MEDCLKRSGHLEKFNESFREAIQKGVYKEVEESELIQNPGIPVNFVGLTESFKSGSSTPVWVCSNSSLKSNGLSLNEILVKGRNDLSSILHNLINFRCGHVGVTGDIAKFYNSVLSQDEDRHLRRVLWRWGDKESNFTQFTTEVVNFGDLPVGRVASCALNMTADRFGGGTMAADILKNRRYVDDFHFVVDDHKQVPGIVAEMERIMDLGGFHIKCVHVSGEEGEVSFLGLVWKKEVDAILVPSDFNFSLKKKGMRMGPDLKSDCKIPDHFSKRMGFRLFGGIYDPLGLISPISIKFKLFLKKVVMEGGKSWVQVLSLRLRT